MVNVVFVFRCLCFDAFVMSLQVQPVNRAEQLLATTHQATAAPPQKSKNATDGEGTTISSAHVRLFQITD